MALPVQVIAGLIIVVYVSCQEDARVLGPEKTGCVKTKNEHTTSCTRTGKFDDDNFLCFATDDLICNGIWYVGEGSVCQQRDKKSSLAFKCVGGVWTLTDLQAIHKPRTQRSPWFWGGDPPSAPPAPPPNQAPSFQSCPGDMSVQAEYGQTVARVNWTTPTASDPDGGPPTVTQTQGSSSGSVFSEGANLIRYQAQDSGGLLAYCVFTISVYALYCNFPSMETTNQSISKFEYSCPDGYSYGTMCTVKCGQGHTLIGENNITCEKDNMTFPPKMFWKWQGGISRRPQCKENRCPELTPPKNGALSCLLGNLGWDCMMSCQASWDIPAYSNGFFYCTNSKGQWMPSTAPDCVVRSFPTKVKVQTDLFYVTNACDVSLEDLQNNFITRMTNSVFKSACVNVPDCVSRNVKVTCGSITSRGKRDLDKHRRTALDRILRIKRNAGQIISHFVQVTLEIGLNYTEDFLPAEDVYKDYMALKEQIVQGLRADANEGRYDFDNLKANEDNVGESIVQVDCPPGTTFIPRNNATMFSCRGCGKGHYMASGSFVCTPCPPDTHTELDDATACSEEDVF